MNKQDDFSRIISQQADRQFRELLGREALEASSAGRWQGELWRTLDESALSLALVPEARGGVALSAADAFEIVRLCGYRALPLPLADTLLAKALWCGAGGDLGLAGDAPVLLTAGAGAQPLAALAAGDGLSLSGTTALVACGDIPGSLLLHARVEGGPDYLVLVDAAALPRTARAGAAFEAPCAFDLAGTCVPPERCRAWPVTERLAFQAHGAVLRSVQMVGAMQRCVELGLRYAAERSQFGRPIGRFAPVQDMLVEAAAETAASLGSTGLAIEHWQLDATADTVFCAAAAKSRCGEAAGKVSALVHQVHGAIGFTQEHVLHQLTRRLWQWRDDFGSEASWNRWLGERACAAPGSALWPRIAGL
jgi:acyl-CoA dehydrogenase